MELSELKRLWERFADIPIIQDKTIDEWDLIDRNFHIWLRFTPKEVIWHWFDEKCPNNLHDDLMFPKKS